MGGWGKEVLEAINFSVPLHILCSLFSPANPPLHFCPPPSSPPRKIYPCHLTDVSSQASGVLPPALNLVASRISKQEEGDKSVLVPPRPFFCPKKASIRPEEKSRLLFFPFPQFWLRGSEATLPPQKKQVRRPSFFSRRHFKLLIGHFRKKKPSPFPFCSPLECSFFCSFTSSPRHKSQFANGEELAGRAREEEEEGFFSANEGVLLE